MRNKRKYDEFQISVLISFIFSIVGCLLNYLFQMIIAKMLTIEQFGAYNSISAFSTNLAIVYTPLSVMTCQLTAFRKENLAYNKKIYRQILIIAIGMTVIQCILGGMLYPYIHGKFGINSQFFLQSILFMTGFSGIYNILYSFIQGRKKFVIYGIIGILLIMLKIMGSILNIQLGYGLVGVIVATLFSYLALCVFNGLYMKKNVNIDLEMEIPKLSIGDIIKNYGITFGIQIIVSFYINGGDIILVEALFTNKDVGLYSSATLIGKVGLYIISIISVVLLPTIAEKKSKDETSLKTLIACLIISLILGIIYAAFLEIIGENILSFLLGKKYTEAFNLLPYVMMYTIPLGLLNIVNSYFLGIGKVKGYLAILIVATSIALFIIKEMVNKVKYVPVVMGIAITIIIVLSVWRFIFQCKREKKNNTEK